MSNGLKDARSNNKLFVNVALLSLCLVCFFIDFCTNLTCGLVSLGSPFSICNNLANSLSLSKILLVLSTPRLTLTPWVKSS